MHALRRDLITWGAALGAGALGTVIADVAGARLGAALTLGVALVMAVVLGALALERQRPSPPK